VTGVECHGNTFFALVEGTRLLALTGTFLYIYLVKFEKNDNDIPFSVKGV
jgi:hypothetical protein